MCECATSSTCICKMNICIRNAVVTEYLPVGHRFGTSERMKRRRETTKLHQPFTWSKRPPCIMDEKERRRWQQLTSVASVASCSSRGKFSNGEHSMHAILDQKWMKVDDGSLGKERRGESPHYDPVPFRNTTRSLRTYL